MKLLKEMTIPQRIALTFALVLVILFALAFIGWISGGFDVGMEEGYRVASADDGVQISKYDELIFKLDREAAGNAYREQIEHLFQTWMKAPGDMQAPARAGVGANNARKAFIAVMEAIERREKELQHLRELSPTR